MANFKRNNSNAGGAGDGNLPSLPTMEIVEPRCSVCKCKYRRSIDQLLVMGVPFSEVARQFEEEGIERRSLANHKKRHLNVEQAAIRRVIEEKARQIGEDVDNTKRFLLTRKGYMEVAMMKSFQAIVDGTLTPEPRDVVHMIALMEKMEKDTTLNQVDEMIRDFNAFTQAVKEHVPKDMYDKILDDFKTNLAVEQKIIDTYAIEAPDVIQTLPTYGDLELPSIEDVPFMKLDDDEEEEEDDE
jgi:hypothetical protein